MYILDIGELYLAFGGLMEAKKDYKLKPEQIRAIETAIAKEQRVEIVPSRDGARLFFVKRIELSDSKRA